ncbi:MAG: glycogen/starch synthase, partial [Candidatus Omnitrophota bacterium]
LEILYHELISHIYKGITNENEAMRDTNAFMWLEGNTPELLDKTVVTISMEGNIPELEGYGVQDASLRGGLGIYFGDKLEGLFDIGIKAFGFQPGYSKIRKGRRFIDADYSELKKKGILKQIFTDEGRPLVIQVYAWDESEHNNPHYNPLIDIEVWMVNRGGTINFILMSSIFDGLYTENKIHRFTQEIVFGKAVYQILNRLNIKPDILHLNEAHTVVAAAQVRSDERFNNTAIVYTIHTTVPAGLERFQAGELRTDINRMMYQIGIPERKHISYRSIFLRPDGWVDFCYAATHLADVINAVSNECAVESKRLFKHMYAEDFDIQVIGALNGSGKSWKNDKLRLIENTGRIATEDELYSIFKQGKEIAFAEVETRTGVRLNPGKPTAWLVRRIVDYKSQYPILRFLVHLICADQYRAFTREELKKIWFRDIPDLQTDYNRDKVEAVLDYIFDNREIVHGLGMQVVVGGPEFGVPFWVKEFIRWSNDTPELKNRFVYVPYSDAELLKYQAIGADICINIPRSLEEACGTSGQRTGLNGGINISSGAGEHEWVKDYNENTGEGSGFLVGPYVGMTAYGLVADNILFYRKAPADVFNKLEIASRLFYTESGKWRKLMYNSYLDANSKVTAKAMEQRYALDVYRLALKMRQSYLSTNNQLSNSRIKVANSNREVTNGELFTSLGINSVDFSFDSAHTLGDAKLLFDIYKSAVTRYLRNISEDKRFNDLSNRIASNPRIYLQLTWRLETLGKTIGRLVILHWSVITRAPPALIVELTLIEEILHYYYPESQDSVHASLDEYISKQLHNSFLKAIQEAEKVGIIPEDNYIQSLVNKLNTKQAKPLRVLFTVAGGTHFIAAGFGLLKGGIKCAPYKTFLWFVSKQLKKGFSLLPDILNGIMSTIFSWSLMVRSKEKLVQVFGKNLVLKQPRLLGKRFTPDLSKVFSLRKYWLLRRQNALPSVAGGERFEKESSDAAAVLVVGVPTEIKPQEARVGLTPKGVSHLTERGIKVIVQKGAGLKSKYSDEEYTKAGATIVPTAKDVYTQARLIKKVKEPLPEEFPLIQEGHMIFTYLHLAADKQLTEFLISSGLTGIAYETVEKEGRTPL